MADWTLPSDRLETRFPDKAPPLSETDAAQQATRCLYCYDAPCIQACPTSIDIPTFIRKIATGNLRGSARTILSANLLGASCARVCPVEVLCEGSCVYVADDRPPVPIGRLQRYAMDHGAATDLLEKKPATGKRVVCIGAGPASLACAGTLALLGHSPVILERNSLPGGLNTTGVAPYKMPADASLAEVEFIRELGVEIRTGVEVGKDATAADLLDEYEAVFLGIGLGPDSRLGVPGEHGPGVVGAVDWIEDMKTGAASVDGVESAAVIGGGNTAVDAVRELLGLGVPCVQYIYRRGEPQMGGYLHELHPSKKEGALILENAAVTEILHQGGRVSALRIVETENGLPTDQELPELPVDLVVLAIGQAKLYRLAEQFTGVQCDARGRVIADETTMATGNPKVFVGGDALNGGKEVVNAVHDGQVAARSIDKLIRGDA
ncbi:MAG: FAD-dependent oxidoreductase [Gemmatimonadetes bacterium]|nr:FAD-dependent oxidoreductase [Gemmatimonadota bacterium]